MNTIRNISAVLILSSLALTALPAGAVSPNTSIHAPRFDDAGDTIEIGPPHANTFCYLSRVGVEETDTGGEYAQCELIQSGSVWVLGAHLSQNNDADILCSAICYNN
jgi:hypothetical protein